MAKFKAFLKESPDRISGSKELWYKTSDAYPFGFFRGKFYFDPKANGKSHLDMLELFLRRGDTELQKYVQENSGYLDSTKMRFHGRFWISKKIFSFWEYPPNKHVFKEIISKLKLRGVPLDSSWKVEVFDNEMDARSDINSRLIPIDEYGEQSKGIKGDQETHLLNAKEKNKALKDKGVTPGYVMKGSKLPKGMSFAEFNHLTKSESLEEDLPTTTTPTSPATGQVEVKVGQVAKRTSEKEKLKKKIKKKLEEDWKDKLKGGSGDNSTPKDVDSKELEMGIKHEMEHTNDKHIATEIAIDHLKEDPKYYTKLKKSGIEESMSHTDKVLKSLMKKAESEGLKYTGKMCWTRDGKTYTYSESQKKFVECK